MVRAKRLRMSGLGSTFSFKCLTLCFQERTCLRNSLRKRFRAGVALKRFVDHLSGNTSFSDTPHELRGHFIHNALTG